MATSTAPWRASRARHVYLAHFRVRFNEVDPLGHVNNAVYLTYLEQTAIDHAGAEGYGAEPLRELGGVFIARRHELDYLRPAHEGNWLRVTTWPLDLLGARVIRAYEIACLTPDELAAGPPADGRHPTLTVSVPAGDLILTARTEWAYVDAVTGRPRRVPAEVVAAFLTSQTE
jgi:acyl-CoA thioester hydrolase